MSTDSWQFTPGDRITPHLVAVRHLGGGNRFEAYTAWDEARAYSVVVKLARPSLTDDPTTRRMLADEGAVLEALRHPVIVRAFEVDVEGWRPLLVLEHIEGPCLSTLVRRHGRLSLEQAVPLGVQLSAALTYLRSLDLVHLDIKPRNVIMAGPPRLIDFSVARTVAEAAKTTSVIGTRTWMAPEQCQPTTGSPVGPAADMWGIGTVLYLALAGHAPFPDDRVQHPQLDAPPARLPRDLPPVMSDLITRCLHPVPSERPTPADLLDELETVLARLPRRMVLGRMRPGLGRTA